MKGCSGSLSAGHTEPQNPMQGHCWDSRLSPQGGCVEHLGAGSLPFLFPQSPEHHSGLTQGSVLLAGDPGSSLELWSFASAWRVCSL